MKIYCNKWEVNDRSIISKDVYQKVYDKFHKPQIIEYNKILKKKKLELEDILFLFLFSEVKFVENENGKFIAGIDPYKKTNWWIRFCRKYFDLYKNRFSRSRVFSINAKDYEQDEFYECSDFMDFWYE